MLGSISSAFSADLQVFTNARLVNSPANDGDSFLVEMDGKPAQIIRLYFVDCPETSTSSMSDAQRVREQARYFGLSDAAGTVHFGHEAKAFVEHLLTQPFTLHTAFSSALGRSASGRVYGFITTADGKDLASLLVQNGFARTHGTGRVTPDGVAANEMVERLRDMETAAMLKRVGLWSQSDPERIAELRGKQRSEDDELKDLQKQATKNPSSQGLLDLNVASKEALESIKGIGPALAERIIAGRPYAAVDDLLRVKGIGPKSLEKIRPYVGIDKK